MNLNSSNRTTMLNSATADADDEKTSDIFGKTLKQFH